MTAAHSLVSTLQEWASRPGRAVIFDFNGTLSDDESILQAIFTDIFADLLGWHMSADHYREELLGMSDREIVGVAVRDHGDGDPDLVQSLLRLRRERYQEAVARRSPISADATELVRRLDAAGVPMGVVTGAHRDDVMTVLDHCEVGRTLTRLVTEEDVSSGKPDPEGFLRGADLIGAAPEDVLVFEDSVPGVTGALRAGMRCIAVTGPSPSPALLSAAPAVTDRLHPGLLDLVSL
jgi:beta-phosphoglucomutase